MDKLEKLSNISSQDLNIGDITNFFEKIKAVEDFDTSGAENFVIEAADLREDVVNNSTDEERALIMTNFPIQQGTYLVVPKVIQ